MPFSHHSHSGQFCSHAKDSLAETVAAARSKDMQVFALTEHISRSDLDLYPGEAVIDNQASLTQKLDDFLLEAKKLRDEVENDKKTSLGIQDMKVLIGFETEWIRPETREEVNLVKNLMARGEFDYFVGSVHHVRTIPVDFDRAHYELARSAAGGSEEQLFAEYFDAQHDMLQALQPKIVAHFDLIRLFSDSPDADLRRWDGLWKRILRNLDVVKKYGGLLEINSAGLRKGMEDPYPRREICEAWKELGGGFVFSDDSHGVEQVAACYEKLLEFVKRLNLQEIAYLESTQNGETVERRMRLEEVEAHTFWNTCRVGRNNGSRNHDIPNLEAVPTT